MKIRNNKIFAVILSLVMVISAVPVFAAENEIHIKTAADLVRLSKDCTLDSWSRDKTVILDNNINIKGSGFKPIPTFGGVFDGNGFTVSGFSVYANEPVQGFFRYVQEGGQVKNLTVKGVMDDDAGKDTFGGIAGINRGNIIKCEFMGNIDGESKVGGIAGINDVSGMISGCMSESTLSSRKYAGGIAGENLGTIQKCINRSEVNTSSYETKVNIEDINIESIENFETSMDEATKPLSGHTDTGGIAGYSSGIIQGCQNYGQIGYQHMGYNTGGIAGRQSGYISGCTNHAQVLGRKDVGGITGQAEPHIVLRYTSGSLQKLDDALTDMQYLVNGMLNDIDGVGADVSDRITQISAFADDARDSSKNILDKTSESLGNIQDFANDNIDNFNDLSRDITELFDKIEPVMDDMKEASGYLSEVFDEIEDALNNFDDADGITDEVKDEIRNAVKHFKKAQKRTDAAIDSVKTAIEMIIEGSVSGNPEKMKAALENFNKVYTELTDAVEDGANALEELQEALKSIDSIIIPAETLGKILSSLKTISESRHKIKVASVKIIPAVAKIIKCIDVDGETIKDAIDEIGNAAEEMESAAGETVSGIKSLADALAMATGMTGVLERVRKGVTDALESAVDSSESIESAFKRLKKIARDISNREPFELSKLDGDFEFDTQSLHTALNGISGELNGLNNSVKTSGEKITADLRAINDKFTEIMHIVIDALTEDKEDEDDKGFVKDISDTDIFKSPDGKVESCTNSGKIEGDINVGGIAGSMAVEYDLDPEDDISSIGKKSLNFRYETKAGVVGSKNTGTVVSKKDHAGGIVGRMDLGTVTECTGSGVVESTGGNYVGGIAGYSDSTIRDCFAKCVLSGKNSIGGIAGRAEKIENCHSIIDIREMTGKVGAISGEVADLADISGNTFIDTGWAGAGGISYSGKAYPVDYATMEKIEKLPVDFLDFNIKFKADGNVIATVPFEFGEDLSDMEMPEIPEKNGCYAKWEEKDLSNMTFSTVINAEYKPWVSVLISSETGIDTDKPIALAEGEFTEGDTVSAQYVDMEGALSNGENTVIQVKLDTANMTEKPVTIRLLVGDEESDLWKYDNGKWKKTDFKENGSYAITDMEADEELFCISPKSASIKSVAALGAVGVLALAFIVTEIRKRIRSKG